ncbi:hypothetical protein JKP88DRAFT_268387 [Tribonema minus]|uniref:CobW C-terminal domain-containing protein n=1 Tax=Tribonema minus TaxID=303371 RepID=A0A835Z3X7_9STRA|nr:hypothetical protein JKP88DRAFT_268387 [Tribonema minus]
MLDLADYADNKPDYLLVETSGVSDPATIVAALEQRFGKLARARLDSVVAVVDADVLGQALSAAAEFFFLSCRHSRRRSTGAGAALTMGTAMRRQLCQADVILINKVDLISEEQRQKLAAAVSELVPSAAPSLHVTVPRAPVTYTSTRPLRLALFQDWIIAGLPAGLVRAKGMLSFATAPPRRAVFNLNRPPRFTLQTNATSSLVRAKGMLSFDTAPPRRAVFNLSGRRRCSVEPGGAWASAPQPYLVMIGEGLDAAALITALTRMESLPSSDAQKSAAAALPPPPADGSACGAQCQCSDAAAVPSPPLPPPLADDADAQQQRSNAAAAERPAAAAATATAAATKLQQRARAVVEGPESRGMYQWLAGSDGGSGAAVAAAAALFRFTGQGLYGLRSAQLRARHGVDLDAVNAAIAQAINTAGGGFITTEEVPMASSYGKEAEHSAQAEEAGENVVALQWALGGETTLEMAWPGIVEHTLRIVKRDLSYITGCNCRV